MLVKDKNNNEYIQLEWLDMPEFVQENKNSIKSIRVHFESLEDMKTFSNLIGKNITMETKGIFFPINPPKEKRMYVDEP